MRVLHLATSDIAGGAARASLRLHLALLAAGVDSRLLVQRKLGDAPNVEQLFAPGSAQGFGAKLRLAASRRITDALTPGRAEWATGLGLAPTSVAPRVAAMAPDIVHVHWVGDEMLSIGDLARLPDPTIVTLHDLWMIAGYERYPLSDRPAQGYASSTRLAGARGPDLARFVWKAKHKTWRDKRFHLVAPSRWAAAQAESSTLFSGQKVDVVANPLDTNRFAPMSQAAARAELDLPNDRIIMAFGAENVHGDKLKGRAELIGALRKLKDAPIAKRLICVVFGRGGLGERIDGLDVREIGYIADDARMRAVLSAADIVAVPSRMETFGQMASEAHACGAPVIGFAGHGLDDVVEPGVTGRLVPPGDLDAFAKAIIELAEMAGSPQGEAMRAAARARALAGFTTNVIASRMIAVYQRILSETPAKA